MGCPRGRHAEPLLTGGLRVCVVYDCVYPWTVGGAERWYGALVRELAAAGCEVTYLTRRQWPADAVPDLPGIRVVAVSPGDELYDAAGRRRTGPPLRFGIGVLRHLLSHRSSYDVVHTNGFPYFSVLAVRVALAGRRRTAVVVEWVEVWTAAYWRDYLGGVGGRVGQAVQRLCVRLTPVALAHSVLHAGRLRGQGYRGPEPVVIGGLLERAPEAAPLDLAAAREPLVVYAGRHIPDKRVALLPEAVVLARTRVPGLRALLLGDGPSRPRVLGEVARLGAREFIDVPGFVDAEQVEQAFARALCVVQPSAREGHGMVVVEAAAAGTPCVLVAGPDNAALELVVDGVTGAIAPEATAAGLADAIVAVHTAGPAMRAAVSGWYAEHRDELGVPASAQRVLAVYALARARAR